MCQGFFFYTLFLGFSYIADEQVYCSSKRDALIMSLLNNVTAIVSYVLSV